MSLVAIKIMLKKAWIYIKNYWYIPFVLLITLFSWISLRKNNLRMLEILKLSKENYQKEIDILKDSHKKEIEIRDELLDQYNDVIDQLEKNFRDRKEELDEAKKEEVKGLVEKYKDNNEALAKEISKKFGVDYVSS